jgi:ferric-dicitrate binding protein FerR (iron transport regulator)
MDKEHLIKKWLNNDLSEAQTKEFKALEDAILCEEIIQEAQRFNGVQHAKVKPFETIESEIYSKDSASFNWIKTASRIAAIFILGIAVFMFLDKDEIYTFDTDYAENQAVTLPDNSIVTLNQMSQLEYNASKWSKKRALELKGEAFFDVKKGKRFDVNTKFGKVSVLGTEFNVLSRDSVFKVACYEGLVQVTYGSDIIKIPAGTEFVLKSGDFKKMAIATAEPYWLKNMSVFEDATMDAVFEEMEKQFNITIERDFEKRDLKFTGAFEHDNIENALNSVTKPFNLTYEITNSKEVSIRNAAH